MTDQTAADSDAELEEMLNAMSACIGEVNLYCETERHHNTMAIILLLRAMDILESRHGSLAPKIVVSLMQERRLQRGSLPTEEQIAQAERMRKFLP